MITIIIGTTIIITITTTTDRFAANVRLTDFFVISRRDIPGAIFLGRAAKSGKPQDCQGPAPEAKVKKPRSKLGE